VLFNERPAAAESRRKRGEEEGRKKEAQRRGEEVELLPYTS